jgi:hypothetical protein
MKEKYLEDLAAIRQSMERSNRVLSLSGLSGVLAGLFALAGSAYAYFLIYYPSMPYGIRYFYVKDEHVIGKLIIAAALVLFLSLSAGFLLTLRKARKKNLHVWNKLTLQLLWNLMLPLFAGGVFILILASRGYFGVIAPAMLLFYGLSLINGSYYTYGDIRKLGYLQVSLGLLAAFFPGFGLIFWAFGFGILHVVYGILMYNKYDR